MRVLGMLSFAMALVMPAMATAQGPTDTKVTNMIAVMEGQLKILKLHEGRLNDHDSRLKSLEAWKKQMEGTEYAAPPRSKPMVGGMYNPALAAHYLTSDRVYAPADSGLEERVTRLERGHESLRADFAKMVEKQDELGRKYSEIMSRPPDTKSDFIRENGTAPPALLFYRPENRFYSYGGGNSRLHFDPSMQLWLGTQPHGSISGNAYR